MRRYLVIYEKSKDGYSAYVPDLPGCTSAGADKEEIKKNIRESLRQHLALMASEGLSLPEQISEAEIIDID